MPRATKAKGKPRTYRFKPGRVKGNTHKKTDALAHLPLTHSMEEHFEWLLIAGYSSRQMVVMGSYCGTHLPERTDMFHT